MNRAERRKSQKKGQAVPKEPVINIKYSDIQKIKKEAAKEAGITIERRTKDGK